MVLCVHVYGLRQLKVKVQNTQKIELLLVNFLLIMTIEYCTEIPATNI